MSSEHVPATTVLPEADCHAPASSTTDTHELSRLRGEVALLRLLAGINTQLRETRDSDAAMRVILRECAVFYVASEGCLVASSPPYDSASVLFSLPGDAKFDMSLLGSIIRGDKVALPDDLTFSRLRRRDRAWGAIVLRRAGGFTQTERRTLARITSAASSILREIDLRRLVEVRDRIDRKSMEQIGPIDLAYHILDALRSLTRYDHSSAVLMLDPDDGRLEVVAEQIAWRKGKSTRIRSRLALTPAVERLLRDETVYCFTRSAEGWQDLEGRDASELANLLDYGIGSADPVEMTILCAPLRGRDRVLGLLKVSSQHAAALGSHEAGLISAFLPQATLALQNARRTEALEERMIEAELKHVMADLARGVAHDLNNALGAVLPMVQQLLADAEARRLDPITCARDLAQVEESVRVCCRIFGGMLAFARRTASSVGEGQLRQAIEGTLAVLQEGLRKRSIEVRLDMPQDVPLVRVPQSSLEQLMLNFISNARDAMPDGGQLLIALHLHADQIELVVQDTGCGISVENLPLIQDAFFTTKSNGTGLGLSLCRSIVWEARGQISFHSEVGRGTRVSVRLPLGSVA